MTVRPSTIATIAAAKRAKKSNRPGKRAPLNLMDTLKAMDREAARADSLEKKIAQLEAKVNWLIRESQKKK